MWHFFLSKQAINLISRIALNFFLKCLAIESKLDDSFLDSAEFIEAVVRPDMSSLDVVSFLFLFLLLLFTKALVVSLDLLTLFSFPADVASFGLVFWLTVWTWVTVCSTIPGSGCFSCSGELVINVSLCSNSSFTDSMMGYGPRLQNQPLKSSMSKLQTETPPSDIFLTYSAFFRALLASSYDIQRFESTFWPFLSVSFVLDTIANGTSAFFRI